jgi:hypothetical protein
MKSLTLTSTLALLTIGGAALAQDTPAAAPAERPAATAPAGADVVDGAYYTTSEKNDFLASQLIGSRIYATTTEVDTSKEVDKVTKDWSDVGEVNNILLNRDGSVKAVILGVGGFLGIGEKDVAVRMSELRFVKKAGAKADDYFIVVRGDKDTLTKAPSYKPMGQS